MLSNIFFVCFILSIFKKQKKIIIYLNTVGAEDPLYKQLASDLGTSDIWTLSTDLANHIMIRDRSEQLYTLFRGQDETKKVPFYQQALESDTERTNVYKAIKGKTFVAAKRPV